MYHDEIPTITLLLCNKNVEKNKLIIIFLNSFSVNCILLIHRTQ